MIRDVGRSVLFFPKNRFDLAKYVIPKVGTGLMGRKRLQTRANCPQVIPRATTAGVFRQGLLDLRTLGIAQLAVEVGADQFFIELVF